MPCKAMAHSTKLRILGYRCSWSLRHAPRSRDNLARALEMAISLEGDLSRVLIKSKSHSLEVLVSIGRCSLWVQLSTYFSASRRKPEFTNAAAPLR